MSDTLTPDQMLVWVALVRSNIDALDLCDRHDFSIDLNPDRPVLKWWQCPRCGGTVSNQAKTWYERGLSDAQPD